ncbi:MAG: hypothetical protein LBT91_02230 [Bifidobacteriaceae bacterium]|jgi:tetratricopeptide (TPR) repeat protein|nr:hypothetical protein [Bifidobacteriaceae bacterium]
MTEKSKTPFNKSQINKSQTKNPNKFEDFIKKTTIEEPVIPEGLEIYMLNKDAISRLKTLPKDLAKRIGLHIVAAQHFMDIDINLAFKHALFAAHKVSRIDVTRETLGIIAYRKGDYYLARRELKTAQRINGNNDYEPMILDCERGLGNIDNVAKSSIYNSEKFDDQTRIEYIIVVAAAKADQGFYEPALALLNRQIRQKGISMDAKERLLEAKTYVYEKMGKIKDIEDIEKKLAEIQEKNDDENAQEYIIYDLENENTSKKSSGKDH